MARITVVPNSILPCQKAFPVDAPTPAALPRRWIQAKVMPPRNGGMLIPAEDCPHIDRLNI